MDVSESRGFSLLRTQRRINNYIPMACTNRLKYTWFVLALIAVLPARAEWGELYCRHNLAAPTDPSSPAARKYAPSREIDILHVAIDVTPDFPQRSVNGQVTMRFKPIAKPLSELKLDGVDLSVASVGSSEKVGGWYASEKEITVTFEPPVPADKEATVNIRYSATPKKGLYFRTPEMGYKS